MKLIHKVFSKIRHNSVFCVQIDEHFTTLAHITNSILQNKTINVTTGNLLLAVILNLSLGIAAYILLEETSNDLMCHSMRFIESIVKNLLSVLDWLLGAPGGLKLNNAFNNVLNKFFYHQINLWWKFIDFWKQALRIIFYFGSIIGCFGITLQASLLSDMIAFVTFHVYCIYLFVARLFNLQISGLIALLRLFVGRKSNPLRNVIDSSQYTSQQLFVGTVAFTILLFLLPTTALYYFVFTLFRLGLLITQALLRRFCSLMRGLQLYTIILWLFNSRKMSGKDYYRIESSAGWTILKKTWKINSLSELIQEHKSSSLRSTAPVCYSEILKSIFRGNIITPL